MSSRPAVLAPLLLLGGLTVTPAPAALAAPTPVTIGFGTLPVTLGDAAAALAPPCRCGT